MCMQQEDRNRAERKLRSAARAAAAHLPTGLPPVFFLTDPKRTPDPAETASRLPAGWGIIYRHFGAADRYEMARRIIAVARQSHVLVLIANDPGLAADVGADGVHWPFAARSGARKWRTRFPLMTASAHSPEQVRLLQDTPVDAALLSTVFASDSPSAGTPMGPLRLRAFARCTQTPLYALGGLTAETASKIAPVAGIAGIEGIERVFGPRT
ncbi:thiamine phosphate synthase [Hyphomonas sp.]|uniref:thiamine phosphate synthase n=1 Tax=Hyphomonas sp. TaxID=87 RepID=UPI003527CFBC